MKPKQLMPNKGGTQANNTPVGSAGQPQNGMKNALRRRMSSQESLRKTGKP